MEAIAAISLAVFLVAVGITHWLVPAYFRTLVPSWAPLPGVLVALTGGLEVVLGVLTFLADTRAIGAWAAALLITGYLVSHVDALAHTSSTRPRLLDRPAGVTARLVVNLAYIAWAVAVALTAP